MDNVKDDFLKHVEGKNIKCAFLSLGDYKDEDDAEFTRIFRLKEGFSRTEYNKFLALIDVSYDTGYGGKELYGYIWYDNGTWSERGEYDGSEWWEYKVCPQIDKSLLNA